MSDVQVVKRMSSIGLCWAAEDQRAHNHTYTCFRVGSVPFAICSSFFSLSYLTSAGHHDCFCNGRSFLCHLCVYLSGCSHCLPYGHQHDANTPGHRLSHRKFSFLPMTLLRPERNPQSLVFIICFVYLFHLDEPHTPFGPPGTRFLMWTRGFKLWVGLLAHPSAQVDRITRRLASGLTPVVG